MLSWILIPTYLFKNSLHRWFENLASPATKLLIPFLLSLFGLAVFGPEAPQRLAELPADERLWSGYCERYESFQQVPLMGQVGQLEQIPVLSYDRPIFFVEIPILEPGQPEEVFLLASGNSWSTRVDVSLKGYSISARVIP